MNIVEYYLTEIDDAKRLFNLYKNEARLKRFLRLITELDMDIFDWDIMIERQGWELGYEYGNIEQIHVEIVDKKTERVLRCWVINSQPPVGLN